MNKNIIKELEVLEKKKEVDKLKLAELQAEVKKAAVAVEAAMEADDIKAYQTAIAKKEMLDYKLSKLNGSASGAYLTPEMHRSLNNSMVKDFTKEFIIIHKEMLETAQKLKATVDDLQQKKSQILNLNDRLNKFVPPENAINLGASLPWLPAARDINILINTLEQQIKAHGG